MTVAVAIQFGYVNAAGANDAVVVSPSSAVTGTALRSLIVSAWESTGEAQPLWVDGEPAVVVEALATHLSIPVGTPDDWWPVDVADDALEPAVTLGPNRAQRRAMKFGAH